MCWAVYPRATSECAEVSASLLPCIMRKARKRRAGLRLYATTYRSMRRALVLAKRVHPDRKVTHADVLQWAVEAVCTRFERALQRRGESASVVLPDDKPATDRAAFTGLPPKPKPRVD